MISLKKLLFGQGRPLLRNAVSCGLWFVALMVLDLAFRIIYERNDSSSLGFFPGVLFDVFWVLIFCGIALLLPRLARRIYMIAVSMVFWILVLVHAAFDSFFGSYLSLSSITFAGDGAGYFDWSYFTISKKLVVMVLFSLVLTVAAVLILPKTKYKLAGIAVAVGILVVGMGAVAVSQQAYFANEGGKVVWDTQQTDADVYEEFSDFKRCLHMCGLYQYTFRDVMVSSGLEDALARISSADILKELDGYYDSKALDEDNAMTGVCKDKNLIVIQLESIDTWMITEAAMPNLFRIQQESVNFSNFFAPKFLLAATFNTENIVNTGMTSPINSSKLSYFTDAEYPYSLPNLFSAAGYTVNSFHRSNDGMYNRGKVHPNWGYEDYVNGFMMGFEGAEFDLDSYLMKAYDWFAPADEKFMSFIITYTGHGAYGPNELPVQRHEAVIREALGDQEVTDEYLWPLCHAYETDLFIGALFERLEQTGQLDDTVVVFYTDHYNHYVTDYNILFSEKGTSDGNLLNQVPFFIYSSDWEAQTVDKPVASYDVLPTIVNLFDLPTDGRYYMGHDAFGTLGGYVMFSDHSWYDGERYVKGSEEPVTEADIARAAEITARLNASWESVKLDYFALKGIKG